PKSSNRSKQPIAVKPRKRENQVRNDGYIQPGNPQQDAYIERFNRTVRYDWLGHYLFESLNELQEFATNWLWVYNHERPNMALGGYTPKQRLAQAA
ncbi:integrase core domain-containing protein, partial [Aeromonas caviae]